MSLGGSNSGDRLLLPLPALLSAEARLRAKADGGERVGVRGRLRKFRALMRAETPPHPKFSRCENFDLSPQAGRGQVGLVCRFNSTSSCSKASPTGPVLHRQLPLLVGAALDGGCLA